MGLDDQNLDQLRALASEHNIEGRSSMNKEQLVSALSEAGLGVVADAGVASVSGFQEAPAYPDLPETREEMTRLLENPDLPAEYQAAPDQEVLNAHLFPERLRY